MGANILYRLGGLLCLAVAAGFGWLFIWQPLQLAEAGAAEIDYSVKAFVFVPFAAVYGLFFLIVGASVPYRYEDRQNFTPAGWIVLFMAATASGLAFWWFQARFDALGYGY
ncbi:MAG TPA: hypothetical protein VJM34_12305 [Novosphingobium sp.]|nr:hypothetical protein [Novosphingobium sp.]